MLDLFLLCILFSIVVVFLFLLLCYFVFSILGNLSENISEKWKLRKQKNEKCRKKTDILTTAISTVVSTNSVFFLFSVSLNFAFLLKTL